MGNRLPLDSDHMASDQPVGASGPQRGFLQFGGAQSNHEDPQWLAATQQAPAGSEAHELHTDAFNKAGKGKVHQTK